IEAVAQPGDLDRAQVLRQHLLDGVRRDAEGDTVGAVADGGVDADQFAVDVQERPARVARVDGRVGLDQVLEHGAPRHGDLPAQGADDAVRDGVPPAVRVADGDHVLADHQIAAGPQRQGGQLLAGLDHQDRQVVGGDVLPGLDVQGGAVVQGDGDLPGAGDDVVAGDDVAALVHDDAGAARLAAVAVLAVLDGLDGHDARFGLLHGLDDGGTAGVGRGFVGGGRQGDEEEGTEEGGG